MANIVGKEEVLKWLEDRSVQRAGKVGVYMVTTDANGGTWIVLAGQTFSGDAQPRGAQIPQFGTNVRIENGIIVEAS